MASHGEPLPQPSLAALVRDIHATDVRLVLAVTGGGSQAIADLLAEPGGSRTLLEALVPYSAESLTAWLGSRPEHFCAARTARAMAMTAFQRAVKLGESSVAEAAEPVGIACTASLASDRPKRGAHRAHLALQTATRTLTHSIELSKGARTRGEEERLVASLLLNLIAEAAGLHARLVLDLRADESVEVTDTAAPLAWQRLVSGAVRLVRHERATAASAEEAPQPGLVIFPGAFNPRHAGHFRMVDVATKLLARPVEYEISIENVDKPRLDYTEMATRLAQFDDAPLWFTRAPTFFEKALYFPQAIFVVGVDTIERINDPKYYGNATAARDSALEWIAARGCRFLVFGRASAESGFRTLSDLELAAPLLDICQEVCAEAFRADISSTELRRSAKQDRAPTEDT